MTYSHLRQPNMSIVSWGDYFFRTGELPRSWKATFIAIIPKMKAPKCAKELQSISLCNVFYKMITKLLRKRLKALLAKLISAISLVLLSVDKWFLIMCWWHKRYCTQWGQGERKEVVLLLLTQRPIILVLIMINSYSYSTNDLLLFKFEIAFKILVGVKF